MEKSFESQRDLHQLLDEGLEAVTANNGRAADSVFADIENRFDSLSASAKQLTDKDGNVYRHYSGRILATGHWSCRGYSNLAKHSLSTYGHIFHYTGNHNFYHASCEYRGPRLDVQIELKDCPYFNRPIEVNIYVEVMDILKYKRMSPKLYNSFESQVGKNIDIFVHDKENIWIDVRSLFSLNYGYRY